MVQHHQDRAPGLFVLLAAGLALAGCNDLNGLSDVSVDEDNGNNGGGADSPAPIELSCAYPVDGAFGVSAGQIVPVNRTWDGYLPGSDQPGTVNISDFYDCDGSRGIDALMIDTSQYF